MKTRHVALVPLPLASCVDYGAPDSVVYGATVGQYKGAQTASAILGLTWGY